MAEADGALRIEVSKRESFELDNRTQGELPPYQGTDGKKRQMKSIKRRTGRYRRKLDVRIVELDTVKALPNGGPYRPRSGLIGGSHALECE